MPRSPEDRVESGLKRAGVEQIHPRIEVHPSQEEAANAKFLIRPLRIRHEMMGMFVSSTCQQKAKADCVDETFMTGPNSPLPFDLPELLGRCLDDKDFAAEMLDIFSRQVPELMSKLNDALQQQAWADAAKAAHTLKGSSGNIAAKQMHTLAAELEHKLRAAELAGTEKLIADFRQTVDACLKAVPAASQQVKA
jgi:HPt (histidine-containing phosphotransfer) domain-containing protein